MGRGSSISPQDRVRSRNTGITSVNDSQGISAFPVLARLPSLNPLPSKRARCRGNHHRGLCPEPPAVLVLLCAECDNNNMGSLDCTNLCIGQHMGGSLAGAERSDQLRDINLTSANDLPTPVVSHAQASAIIRVYARHFCARGKHHRRNPAYTACEDPILGH